MSVKVLRSSLSPEMVEKIRTFLVIQPQEAPQYNKITGTYISVSNKPPITFYLLDQEYVYLPYKAGSAILQKPANQERNLPHADFKFTATLYDYQIPVLEDAYKQLQVYGTVSLKLRTGWGKTIGGAELAAKLGKYVLVLFPRTILIKPWLETFKKCTNATTWCVGEEKQPLEQPHAIICYEERYDKIPPQWRENIGTLILDEAHLLCTKSRILPLLCTQPMYIIAETATLARTDGLESMMIAMVGTNCIEKNLVVDPDCKEKNALQSFQVFKVNTDYKPEVIKTNRGTDYNLLLDDIVNCQKRNKYIVSLAKAQTIKKILILTMRREHTELLHQMLLDAGETSVDILYGGKKSYQDSRIIVATLQRGGTGFDEKNTAVDFNGQRLNCLILTCSIKNTTTLTQAVGRIMRDPNPVVYHLIDNNPTIKRHWTQNKKWYVSCNATIQELNIQL